MDPTPATQALYNKDNPFPALIRENRLLSGSGSAKETRHFVVDIKGSGLAYKCGDSLGIFPQNPPELVEEVIRLLGATGEEPVSPPRSDEVLPLCEALLSRVSLATPTKKTLQFLLPRLENPHSREQLEKLLMPEFAERLQDYLSQREIIDLLEEFPGARIDPKELVPELRKLVPRLYSIASSPVCHPDEVHLTIAVVRYQTNNRQRLGVCSTFVADRVQPHQQTVPVFVASAHFGLPEDPERDIIMVGPGTGVAPFRAFLQERIATGATGRNWLFFGDQHHATDYLYGEEFDAWHRDGKLHRLDLAWSRDQEHKIYVQNRMLEHASEIWKWLDGGAIFYVCGDAKRMAKDVDAALHDIIAQGAGLDAAGAADYVKQMKKDRRYQRDVY
ncbi:MAG: sulfite reductase subunit alpha [Puniceicoccaceae bacterium]|nr:MAG: sulfite reductase subunit alpha [Puniceicoccaceae bacterium]